MNKIQRIISDAINFIGEDIRASADAEDNLKRSEAIKNLAEAYSWVSPAEPAPAEQKTGKVGF